MACLIIPDSTVHMSWAVSSKSPRAMLPANLWEKKLICKFESVVIEIFKRNLLIKDMALLDSKTVLGFC